MEPTFLQFIVSATGTTGLAAFAIWLLNQARQDIQALITQFALANREDKLLLIKVLDDSAKAQSITSTKVDALLSVVTKWEERASDERRSKPSV